MNKQLTPLDEQLHQIALSDWPKFISLIGEDAVIAAKVCLLRQNGNSYGQIKGKLKITIDKIRWECKQCEQP